jgi:hypothetical protein
MYTALKNKWVKYFKKFKKTPEKQITCKQNKEGGGESDPCAQLRI